MPIDPLILLAWSQQSAVHVPGPAPDVRTPIMSPRSIAPRAPAAIAAEQAVIKSAFLKLASGDPQAILDGLADNGVWKTAAEKAKNRNAQTLDRGQTGRYLGEMAKPIRGGARKLELVSIGQKGDGYVVVSQWREGGKVVGAQCRTLVTLSGGKFASIVEQGG